jgi:hypothetical protein
MFPPPPHPRSWRPAAPPIGAEADGRVELPPELLLSDLERFEQERTGQLHRQQVAASDLDDFAEDDLKTTPYQSDFPPPDPHAHQQAWPEIPPSPMAYSSWPPTVIDARATAADLGDRLTASTHVFLERARVWRARAVLQADRLFDRWGVAISEHWDRFFGQGGRRQGWLRSRAPYVVGLLVVATSMFSIGRTIDSESEAEGPAAAATGPSSGSGTTDEARATDAQAERSASAQDLQTASIALPPVPGVSLGPDKEAPILVSLAENLLAARRDTEAVPVLERALARNPKLTDDPGFLRVVKRAALSEDRLAAAQAYALLVGPMGERGAEILYEISVSPASRPSVRERAAYFVYTKDFERKAPLPLYAAFKLVSAPTCEAKKSLLPFAAEAGGRHALAYLKELDQRKVCTLDDLDNCYSCMNSDEELPRTIAEIEARLGGPAR